MHQALEPALRQLEETCEAVHISLRSAGAARLAWKPAPHLPTFAMIVEHIASGNLAYATAIGPVNVRRCWELDPSPSMEWLVERLDESLATARRTLEGVTDDNLHLSRADDWCPNCEEQVIQGPLDALWFAMQMARHTAYHLGQLNMYLQLMESTASQG